MNGLIGLVDASPIFRLNIGSSSFEPIYYNSVLVTKCDLGNFLTGLLRAFESEVWQLSDSLLQLKLNVKLELSYLGDGIGLVEVVLTESIVELIGYVELDGVVTSRDCLDIKVNAFCLLHTLDVVEVDDGE